jgi:hypothetical protein
MKKIKLTRNKYALVDNRDFKIVSQFRWHCTEHGYAARRDSTNKLIYMHRFINQTPNNLVTDHRNGNKLDNTRNNLRSCLPGQNTFNSKTSGRNKSGYRGICLSRGLWLVQTKRGETRIRKNFKDFNKAVAFREECVQKLYGDFRGVDTI